MEVDGAGETRTAKRQKLTNGSTHPQRAPGTSRIFAPYRTVGLVSPTAVPFTTIPLGRTTFQITTSVGRSLQTYDLRRGLNLVFLTRPQTPEEITATAAWKDHVFAAWGGKHTDSQRGIWVFKRGKKVADAELPKFSLENVKKLCVFGSWIVGVCETKLHVWKTATLELYTTLQGISPIPFTSCIASIPTLLNKIIVGREDGSAEIWNVSSGKLLYTILPRSTAWGSVTAIEPTPALSLVAIAYEKGPLVIHDVQADQVVIQLNSASDTPLTSIAFRTDGLGAGEDGRNAGVMATATKHSGDITLWDLNEGGRKAGTLRAAHAHPTSSTPGGVSKIEFLSGQHILLSSGLDNSLKTWIFDSSPFSPVPRVLHSRSGHGASVTALHFLPSASDGSDDTGKWLMSGSGDRSLWGWSLRRDGQSTELSQGAVLKKAKKQGLLSAGNRDSLEDLKCSPITAIASSLNRDGGIGALPGKQPIWQASKGKQVNAEISAMTGWESVLTAHANDKKARTWFWGRKRAGRWAFETGDGGNVTAVAISPCGTFALVGSEKGSVDMYNLQSGMHRQRFPVRLTLMQAKQLKFDIVKHGLLEETGDEARKFYRGQGRHGSAVVGVAVDNLNKVVISAGANGKVKFWDFSTGLLQHEIDWTTSTSILHMRFHRGSNLAAFACEDGHVRIVDISSFKLVRELFPSRPQLPELSGTSIADLAYSPDGSWLAACMGQLVLLWDLATGHLVDAFKLKAQCTSLAFSPTGEYLATATTDNVGVDIWSNRALFMHVPMRHIGSQELSRIFAGETQAPTASGEGGQALITTGPDDADEEDIDIADQLPEIDVEQLASSLLSLSIVPRSQWQNLLHLDLIRQRNRPIEPPKKPEKAPFFLPSLQERQTLPVSADTLETTDAQIEQERSRVLKLSRDGAQTTFTTLLRRAASTGDYVSFLQHLRSLSPAAADIEIRSLTAESDEMLTFIHSLTWLMSSQKDFELVQAWMAVFLHIHGDAVVADDGLREAVEQWRDAMAKEKARVQRLLGYCNGLAGYLRAARV